MSAETPTTEVTTAPAQEDATNELGYKIFVGNLAYATTDEGLKTLFASVVSDILSVQVIQRSARSAGYGFVSVDNIDQVEKAVHELNGKDLDGRKIIVEAARPAEERERNKKRFKRRTAGRRGNKAPPGEVTEAEANGEANEPEVAEKKRVKKARKPKNKNFAPEPNVTAPSAEGGTPAEEVETPAENPPRKPRRPRAPRPPRVDGEQPDGEASKSVLFVANLAFNVDDAALTEIFVSSGIKVVSARVVRRRFGQPRRSKGYGFVDVGTEEQQKKALEAFAGKEVNGREIAVKVAVSSPTVNSNIADAEPSATEKVQDVTAPAESTDAAY